MTAPKAVWRSSGSTSTTLSKFLPRRSSLRRNDKHKSIYNNPTLTRCSSSYASIIGCGILLWIVFIALCLVNEDRLPEILNHHWQVSYAALVRYADIIGDLFHASNPMVSNEEIFYSSRHNYTALKYNNEEVKTTESSRHSTNYEASVAAHHRLLDRVTLQLLKHPTKQLSDIELQSMALEDIIAHISSQKICQQKPVFISMASVASDTYWQMIENFIYTMVKFEISSCALMICVSDNNCMNLCRQRSFPCYHHEHRRLNPTASSAPSIMEQIAQLKLFYLPKASAKNVDMFMIDLDVGFLGNPMELVYSFYNSSVDVYVQEDISFVMHRSVEKWRTWFTVPLPNIGLFLCRGNKRVVRMFDHAWLDYQSITKPIKHNPGKDQNKVVNAMMNTGTHWAYFPKNVAVLLDKVYKFQDQTYELGGEAAVTSLQSKGALAAHTTCYEQNSKVMGLKSANAFWNPFYYDPGRRTITKRLVYIDVSSFVREVKALVYLALVSNRTLIIPNVLGNERRSEIPLYQNKSLWPGFRVAHYAKGSSLKIDVVEPAFYWRIARDYKHQEVPRPLLLSISHRARTSDIEELLLSPAFHRYPRVVVDILPRQQEELSIDARSTRAEEIEAWANDGVGLYDFFQKEKRKYSPLPPIHNDRRLRNKDSAEEVLNNVRLCSGIFEMIKGNRSCFDKCD